MATIGESRGGIDKEMGDEERNEEENDGKEGIKLEMEREIWIVEEKKWEQWLEKMDKLYKKKENEY